MPSELNPESADGAANDEPKVFTQEEDEGDLQDHLSDVKEGLVHEGDPDTRPSTASGESKEAGDGIKNEYEKKPFSLYPEGFSTNLFSQSLFNGLAPSMPFYMPYGIPPTDFERPAGLLPFQLPFGGLPHALSPWTNPYAAAGLGGLRYPFPGLRGIPPNMGSLPGLHPNIPTTQPSATHTIHKQEEKR
jgi:hypothetical protein